MHIMEVLWVLLLNGSRGKKKPFAPLIPEVDFVNYNSFEDIDKIDNQTSCVVLKQFKEVLALFCLKTDI